jgi:hypothetical protein
MIKSYEFSGNANGKINTTARLHFQVVYPF